MKLILIEIAMPIFNTPSRVLLQERVEGDFFKAFS
jgi:hypothetical protein